MVQDRRCCYTPLIGSIIWPIDSCHFQRPWMTSKVIHLLQGLSNTIRWTCVRHFTRFQLNWHGASRCPSAIAEFLVTYWYSIFTLGMRPVLWRNGVTSWCHSSRNTRWFNESGPGDLFTLKMFNLWSITSSLKVTVSYGFVGHRDGSTVNVPSLSHVYTPAK